MEKNPFIEPEDYFQGYKENIENLKNDPSIIEFDKLCYELFEHQEAGRRFMEIVNERYLIPSLVQRGNATYQLDVMWQEGFKDFARMLRLCTLSHAQRIKSGIK